MSEHDETDLFVANTVHPDASALLDASYSAVEAILCGCDVVLDTNVLLAPYANGKSSLEQLETVYGRLRGEGRRTALGNAMRFRSEPWRASSSR